MNKSSITFRRCKKHIQVYRTIYKQSHQRIFLLEKDLSNLAELETLLTNDTERRRLFSWQKKYRAQRRRERIEAILERGPDEVMFDVAEALAELAKSDARGQRTENQRIGIRSWWAWTEIYATIGSTSAWKINQKGALEKIPLSSKSMPKRDIKIG